MCITPGHLCPGGYFNSNLAREVARLTGWTGKIWERRYQAIPISDEEEAQAARLRYVLGHGVKETLVAHLREWPGLHCVRQIVDGEPLSGHWYDRTQEYLARRQGKDADPLQHATPETVTLSPLPCWKHLSPQAYRECVANLASEIEEDAAIARRRTGAEPLGVAAILAQELTNRPKRLKKSPARRCSSSRVGNDDTVYCAAPDLEGSDKARHPLPCIHTPSAL